MLRAGEDCADLNEFLEKFELPTRLLQTEVGLRTAMENLLRELKEDGVIYAEIRFAPQLHTQNGLTAEDAVRFGAVRIGHGGGQGKLCRQNDRSAACLRLIAADRKYRKNAAAVGGVFLYALQPNDAQAHQRRGDRREIGDKPEHNVGDFFGGRQDQHAAKQHQHGTDQIGTAFPFRRLIL